VKFNTALAAVSETNMLEEKPRKLRLNRNAVSLYMKPFEIKTLYCEI
jgi:alpha-mannosidase